MVRIEQKVSLDSGIILRKHEEYEVYMCDRGGQDQQITSRGSVFYLAVRKSLLRQVRRMQIYSDSHYLFRHQ